MLRKFFSDKRKVVFLVIVILFVIGGLFKLKILEGNKQQVQYQTEKAEKGTIISAISGSGQVSTANSMGVTTQATGVVKTVYVTNGQIVQMGDPLVELDLDRDSNQKYLQALASYQGTKNSLDASKANQYGLQSDMFNEWQTFMAIAQNSTYQNADGTPNNINRSLPEFHIAEDDWLSTEAKYKNQQGAITQAQTALSSSWISYQQSSPVIYSPISGTVTGFTLQQGAIIAPSSSSSTTTSQSSQKIAVIMTNAAPTVTIDASEIDAPKIKQGNKVTITLDALPDKTYTGKVTSIDISGAVNSDVTTYPVTITLDSNPQDVYPNMSATANIIVATKDNVVVVPSSAIQTQNGESVVQIKKNGQYVSTPVEIGIASDTQTEIISGVNEGDEIVTSTVSSQTGSQTSTSGTRSPFSANPFGGGIRTGGGFGGGATRRQ
ncbi:MAG: efflux RND transporter periplasmic adaptor subunit [bacterium]|nr:efflux RND transporter periplasmic adaptor subunit [bacterium]